jgi:hypothetical protein
MNHGALEFLLFTVGDILVVSVADMVDKVLDRAGKKKISNMFVGGHGSPGWQSVGAGSGDDTTGTKSLQIDAATGGLMGTATRSLNRLIDHFDSEAIVTLGGCNVGASPDGPPMLKAVSVAIGGIPVQAGVDTQRPLVPGMEGKVIRCTPNAETNVGSSWWGTPGSWIN